MLLLNITLSVHFKAHNKHKKNTYTILLDMLNVNQRYI